ncbi:hypothetical protein BsWGS_05663 [Bradybaena similaris]
MFLNSLDFPALTVPSRPVLNITSSTSSMSNVTTIVTGSKKRPMKREDEDISDEDSLSGSQKKPRKLSYREPPPILQSLDSDAFKALFESPTLSDSQSSELSSSWQSPRASTSNFLGENLGSLGDIIQKYTYTTLDSLKGFEVLDSAIAPTCTVDPPDLKLTGDTAVKLPANILSSSAAVESQAPAKFSHGESDLDVRAESQTSKLCELKSTATESKTKSDVSKNESDSNANNGDDDYPGDEENEEEDPYAINELFESDLKHYKKCKKHKNHAEFYLVPDLQVKDLPNDIQHEDTVTFLSCLSQLVVQITVHSTSAARGPKDMYSSYIGTTKKRYGSGFIASVDDDIRRYRCRKENCPHATFFEEFNSSFDDSANMGPPNLNRSESSTSSTSMGPPGLSRSESNTSTSYNRSVSNMSTASSSSNSSTGSPRLKHVFYSGVTIHTNKHVIFDKSEAESAYVKFFYNTPGGKEVIHGHVSAITGINNSQDHVVLHVMSHDRAVFTTLGLCLHKAASSYKQMVQSTSNIQRPVNHKNKHDWVAIISHPHGMEKAISFGRIITEKAENLRIIKYYDAATCPGSSGGLVITPSLLKLQWPGAVHSCTDLSTGYNVTFDSRSRDLDPNDTDRIYKNMFYKNQFFPDDVFQL